MSKYSIPNLSNACQILKLIVNSERGMTRDEVSDELEIPRTTTYRILQTLSEEEFLEHKCYRYFPGSGLYALGLSLSSIDRLRPIAKSVLHHLSAITGFTAHLAIPSGYKTLIIEVCDSQSLVRVASRPGTLAPLHVSATGKVFLAYLFPNDLEAIDKEIGFERFTNNTQASVAAVREEIQVTLRRGYAVDDREFNDNVRCLAVPLFDMAGNVIAAIGVTSPVSQFSDDLVSNIAAITKEHAQRCYKLLKTSD
jgi:DNA-binding IclR family transcriptional regulator